MWFFSFFCKQTFKTEVSGRDKSFPGEKNDSVFHVVCLNLKMRTGGNLE